MADNILDLLFRTLEELKEAELKRFKMYLSNRTMEEFEPIPRGRLEKSDVTDVVSEMMEAYGEEGSVTITLTTLRKMNLNNLANELEERDAAESGEIDDAIVQEIKASHKKWMMEKFGVIDECIEDGKNKALLSKIYTELYITEGENEGVNTQHEVRRIETQSKCLTSNKDKINSNDIFKCLPEPGEICIKIQTVMTTGIAGIGKSVCVQKFILDWADGSDHQDIDFIFALPFRRLNLKQNDSFSLRKLLDNFHELDGKYINTHMLKKLKIIFIFDGLDESKLSLNFGESAEIRDPQKTAPVDILITNLIKGNLLPKAFKWITSRPAAVKRIPGKYIHRWTEVQGFNDQQKDEYFKKKIEDPEKAGTAITHIKRSKSLYIMCHIPVFCWILATVFLKMIHHTSTIHLPNTLTEVYIGFLLTETKRKGQKHCEDFEQDDKKCLTFDSEAILKLSKLAYQELEKGNIIFYEDSLTACGISENEITSYSGMCSEFFKTESVGDSRKVFCFMHLSIQEFLAALFVFHSFLNKNIETLGHFTPQKSVLTAIPKQLTRLFKRGPSHLSMTDLLRSAIDKSMQREDGQLDLFLRFLLGISLESNQKLLQGLLTHKESSSDSLKETAKYIRKILSEDTKVPERCMNLLLCLLEMKDNSIHLEIQQYINSGELLSPTQCSRLAYILQVSEETTDEFDLTKYKTTNKGRKRLLVVLKVCRKARLVGCDLQEDSCEVLVSVLQSENSLLKELDLSSNPLRDSGVRLLCVGLEHTNCKLETMRLGECKLSEKSCGIVATVLQSPNSLIELDLSHNDLGDSGVHLLSKGLSSPNCKLQTLRLGECKLSEKSCGIVATVLQSPNSLIELDLSHNDLGDSGVHLLSKGLSSPNCKLQTLRFADCKLTDKPCEIVASVLQSPNSLLQLDLSDNDLGDSGVQLLSKGLSSFNCKIHTLRLSDCLISEKGCGFLASALTSNPSHRKELDLSYNHPGESGLKLLSARLEDPVCKLERLKTDHSSVSRARPRLQRYACDLTLDPNTAHRNLSLSEGNRKVTHVNKEQPYPEHPERFDRCAQVLCKEGLTGRCYWEAEWSGEYGAEISVVYKSTKRKGNSDDIIMGQNAKSWSLFCSPLSYSVRHNNEHTAIPAPSSGSRRVGVYLDWPASTLSFYSVSSDTLTHLHTFHSTFTEPLCPGFLVWSNSSVSLCQIT
ncbi:NACHT, LRR and PYD domains-containing protein 3-like [Sardina pilchardus]|uniref:NACHT, LRR and PYD domains-containing protein 3-like n=1 Tax=Sardina pilchardus TaxID=27697 RepID=UPI002E146202